MCVFFFGAVIMLSATGLRQRTTLSADGIRRRGLLREKVVPWSAVHRVGTRPISTTGVAVGVIGMLTAVALKAAEKAVDPQPLWRVEADLDVGGGMRIPIGDVRGEDAALAWADELDAWMATQAPPV
jgi:hypothetical protein